MLKKPKYALGQVVEIKSDRGIKSGKIVVVDARGTSEQNDEPSYYICVETETMVYKHIHESQIVKLIAKHRKTARDRAPR